MGQSYHFTSRRQTAEGERAGHDAPVSLAGLLNTPAGLNIPAGGNVGVGRNYHINQEVSQNYFDPSLSRLFFPQLITITENSTETS